jgi:nucleoid-associated protein YgaU
MLRRFSFTAAAVLALTVGNPTHALAQQPAAADASTGASSTTSSGDDVAALKAENATLKKEVSDAAQTIAQLQAKLAQAGVQPSAATGDTNAAPAGPQKALPLDSTNAFVAPAGTPGATNAPAADAGPSKTYTVVKGDSLWKIAHKMYPGDTKNGVDKIQEANKDAIGGKPLKIGQVLVIPQ